MSDDLLVRLTEAREQAAYWNDRVAALEEEARGEDDET